MTVTNIKVALHVTLWEVLTLALSADTIHKRQGSVTYRLKTSFGNRGRKQVVMANRTGVALFDMCLIDKTRLATTPGKVTGSMIWWTARNPAVFKVRSLRWNELLTSPRVLLAAWTTRGSDTNVSANELVTTELF